jgi:hypothetical protein
LDKETSEKLEFNVLFVLSILSNYQKYEIKNSFILKIANLKSGNVIDGLIETISEYMNKCNVSYYEKTVPTKNSTGLFSFVSAISGWIGSWVSQQKKDEGSIKFHLNFFF